MKLPEIPHNEEERISALKQYNILDTGPENDFDDLANLASQICGTEIALVSLIDVNRQWFKAKIGELKPNETPRDVAFCAHTILSNDILIVPDATKDDRFFDNPLVIKGILKFYAGSPLINKEGYKLGSLCVLDPNPKDLTEDQLYALKVLSRQVMAQIELRKKVNQLNNQLSQTMKALERESKVKEEARKASRIKSRFMAHMSHEIRTPLHGIMGMVELLKYTSLDQEQLEYISILSSTTLTLQNIINDVLDISKIESGKINIHKKPFMVLNILNELYEQFLPEATKKGINFTLDVSQLKIAKIENDEVKLKQILVNLINNAIKFTNEGHIDIKVVDQYEEDGTNSIKFSIRDSGIGITHDKQAIIFEEFQQADNSTSRKYGGTGLGTTIAKKLTELLGGEIGLKSPIYSKADVGGPGTEFWFKIPVQDLDYQNSLHLDSSNVAPKEEHTSLNHLKVLVAEDNLTNQFVIDRHLKKMGVKAKLVSNGQEVIDILKRESFDLILMDIVMPVLNGLEATKWIRKELESKIPIIVLTANAFQEDLEMYLAAGVDECLSKPFTMHDLSTLIKKYLNMPINN